MTSLLGAVAILLLGPILVIPFFVVEYLDKGIDWLLSTFHGRCK